GVRQPLFLTVRQILNIQLKFSFATRDECQGFAIRRDTRADVIAAAEGNAARVTAVDTHAINLWCATTVAGEVNRLTIAGKLRFGINAARTAEAAQPTTVGVDDINLRQTIA